LGDIGSAIIHVSFCNTIPESSPPVLYNTYLTTPLGWEKWQVTDSAAVLEIICCSSCLHGCPCVARTDSAQRTEKCNAAMKSAINDTSIGIKPTSTRLDFAGKDTE